MTDFFNNVINQSNINYYNMALRLFLSFIIGGLIGFEREKNKQPAGLRTHIIICVGSTLLMILSIYVPQTFLHLKGGDPGRIAAQVVSGIGFLGAGAILRLGVDVKGLTTAATIWVVSGIGLALGAGLYYGAIICAGLIIFSLAVVNVLEKKIFPSTLYRCLQINIKTEKIKTNYVFPIIEKYGIIIKNIDISQSMEEKLVKMRFLVQMPEKIDYKNLYKDIGNIKGVNKVNLDQNI